VSIASLTPFLRCLLTSVFRVKLSVDWLSMDFSLSFLVCNVEIIEGECLCCTQSSNCKYLYSLAWHVATLYAIILPVLRPNESQQSFSE
jgi:hypothetical protein